MIAGGYANTEGKRVKLTFYLHFFISFTWWEREGEKILLMIKDDVIMILQMSSAFALSPLCVVFVVLLVLLVVVCR